MSEVLVDAGAIRGASVLVVGDLMLDTFVYGEVSRISPEAPIPVLRIKSQKNMAGGAANVSANVAALEGRATIIGVVGSDVPGSALAVLLRDAHANSGVELVIDADRPTTIKTRFIAGTQQMLRADHEVSTAVSAATAAAVTARARKCLADHDVLALSDYSKGVLTDAVIEELIAAGRQAGKPVIIDPKRQSFAIYRGASYIKPNVSELTRATGIDCTTDEGAAAAAQQVIEQTGSAVLLTRSEKGLSLFRPQKSPVHVRSTVQEVYDVSGAGDTVLAAFSAALAAGQPDEIAIEIANAAGGIAVSKLGTAIVSLAELSAVLSDGHFFGSGNGVMTAEKAAAVARLWKARGLKVGFTNGCFDIVHSGHVTMLAKAASHCDRLIVGLNTDASVRRLKGPARPVQSEASRLEVLASLKPVDAVTLFDDDTPIELIKAIEPDVLFKGADYAESQVVGGDIVKKYGGKIVLIDLVENMSTTNAIRRAVGLMGST